MDKKLKAAIEKRGEEFGWSKDVTEAFCRNYDLLGVFDGWDINSRLIDFVPESLWADSEEGFDFWCFIGLGNIKNFKN